MYDNDQRRRRKNFFVYRGTQQTVKTKVVNLLKEKLKRLSDNSNDMNESEVSDKLFDFLYKTNSNLC